MDSNLNTNLLTQEFWDANPCGLDVSWENSKYLRFNITDPYLRDYLNEVYFAGKKVLEVGCGQGADASIVLQFCDIYCGIDLSGKSLQIAKREVSSLNMKKLPPFFAINDAEYLGFGNRTFDLVYSIGVLHHTASIAKALSEIQRVLKKDGLFIFMLYRRYTPLWVIMSAVRGMMHLPLIGYRLRNKVLRDLRTKKSKHPDSLSGTVLIELVGSPIINTYSRHQVKRLLRDQFEIIDSRSYRVGFDQIVRIIPQNMKKFWPHQMINRFEEKLGNLMGFYLVTVANKV